MIRDNLKDRIEQYFKKGDKIFENTTIVDSLIQEAVDNISSKLLLFPTSKTFNIVADQFEYAINNIANDYLTIDSPGIKFKNSDGDFEKLYAYSISQLYDEFPYWETDESSEEIERYVIDKNRLILHPAANEDQTDGGKIYYIKRPNRITAGTQYIFSGSTDIMPQYETLDLAVIYYVLAFLNTVSDKQEALKDKLNLYYNELDRQKSILNKRPDIVNDAKMRFYEVNSITH